jgi:hypothetical protein
VSSIRSYKRIAAVRGCFPPLLPRGKPRYLLEIKTVQNAARADHSLQGVAGLQRRRRTRTGLGLDPLPGPSCKSLSPRGLAWEKDRYRAYESRLAGRTVAATFSCASSFLNVAAADITAPADHKPRPLTPAR